MAEVEEELDTLAVFDALVKDVESEDVVAVSVNDESRLTAESELDELAEAESLEETFRGPPWWW